MDHSTLPRLPLLPATLAVALVGTALTSSVSADLLAYEGFDYSTGVDGPVGKQLPGQGSAADDGWAGAWSGDTDYQVVTGDMAYPGIPTSGGRVRNDWDSWTNMFRSLDVTGTFGAYAEVNGDGDDVIGKDGTTIWLSFLLSGQDGNSSQGNWLGLADDYVTNWSATVNIGAIKAFPRPWDQLRLFQRRPADGGGHEYPMPPEADSAFFQDGTTQLMLVEVIFGAQNDDTVNLYINEDAEGDPSTFVPDATMSGFDMGFHRIMLGQADTRNIAYGWDEIRIGDTVGDVLPNTIGSTVGPLRFTVDADGLDLVFTWTSQAGKVYDLLSSTDPEADGDPETWTLVAGQEDLAASGTGTNTLTITRPADNTRFYVIREENAPPPPPLFSDDFESNQGWENGTGANHAGTTAWERGAPDTNFLNGPVSGANGSANCFGTDLDADYQAGTEIWLRSPSINLTEAAGATLSFWHIFDVDGTGDETAVVRVLDAADDSELAVVETFSLLDLDLLDWDEFTESLPAAALGKTIRLEFRFTVDPGAGQLFPGWYIDEVAVEAE